MFNFLKNLFQSPEFYIEEYKNNKDSYYVCRVKRILSNDNSYLTLAPYSSTKYELWYCIESLNHLCDRGFEGRFSSIEEAKSFLEKYKKYLKDKEDSTYRATKIVKLN